MSAATRGAGFGEHIVLVLVDQMRADCISAFGHPVVRTPNLDALVADGVGFRRVITQAPLCVPARMSLFSGRYVHQHGCLNNGVGFWPETDNIVRRIREAGYVTGVRGKLHLFWRHDNELLMSDHMLRVFGFDDPMETTGKASQGRLRASAYTEFLKSRGLLEKHMKWLWDLVRARQTGVSFAPSILAEDEQMDGWIMDRGREMVRAHLEGDKPMLAWIGPEGPHDPFDPPGKWARMYDPAEVDLPILRRSEDPSARHRAKWSERGEADEDLLRQMRALYYGNISFIDDRLGRLVEDLKARDAYDDTWIIFASDHGEMLGDFFCTTKTLFHRQAVDTPLVIKPPRRLKGCPRGTVTDCLVELIDLGSTMLDIAGATIDGDRGRSLMPILTGQAGAEVHRQAVRSQVNDMHMVQTIDRKLIYRTEDPRSLDSGYELLSLFDTAEDGQELRNLLPDRAEEAEAMFARLEPAFYEATADHLQPQWPDEAPFRHWGRYPILDVLDEPAYRQAGRRAKG